MRSLVFAAVSLIALCAAAPAADLPMPYKAPLPQVSGGWSGFYLGLNGGGGIALASEDCEAEPVVCDSIV